MRVLAVGFALPNPEVDNYSFAQAPSFFDYDAVVVDPSAVSRLIEEVVDQTGEHVTNSREPVNNGATSPIGTGLADLLRRRQMETERLLALGRPIVCFAYPNVYHHRVAGFTGCDRYFWLPAPSGMQYRESHLLPGDGSTVITTDSEHPFASYVDAFKKRLGYRAYFADAIPNFSEFGHVFARSAGGAAVGVELTVGAGRIVFIPPVAEPGASSDRHPLAKTIVDCLRRLLGREAEGPAPLWLKEYTLPGLAELETQHETATSAVAEAQGQLAEAKANLQELDKYRHLLWQEGKYGLEATARDAFSLLGFQITPSLDEPCALFADSDKILLEVEGAPAEVGMEPHYRLRRRLEEAIAESGKRQKGVLLVNGFRLKTPADRATQYSNALRVAAESMRYCLLTSTQLFEVTKRHLEGDQQIAGAFRQCLAASEGVFDLDSLVAAAQPQPSETANSAPAT